MKQTIYYSHLPASQRAAKARADVKAYLGDKMFAALEEKIKGHRPETIILICSFVGVNGYPARVMAGLEK